MAAGILSVWLLGLAVARLGGRTAGLVAAGLLATNYVWVMYSRAALMEAQSLHDRIGVKSILRGVEKRLAAAQLA